MGNGEQLQFSTHAMISTVQYSKYYTILMLKTLGLTWFYHLDFVLDKTEIQTASSYHKKSHAAFISVFPPPS